MRRIARHDDQEFSNQSILNAMEKFVKTVNAMDETILVPSRLMDCSVSHNLFFLFDFSLPNFFVELSEIHGAGSLCSTDCEFFFVFLVLIIGW